MGYLWLLIVPLLFVVAFGIYLRAAYEISRKA